MDFYALKQIILQFLAQYIPYFSGYRAIEPEKSEDEEKVELKIATPEELFSEKILNKQYEEALAIARKYNLNADLVYQTQWEKSAVSSSTIDLFLRKVSDTNWSLNQCVNRVAETIDGQRLLLNFGLEITKKDHLLLERKQDEKQSDEDSNHSESKGVSDVTDGFSDTFYEPQLSLEEQQRVLLRFKLLRYSDKLSVMEHILGQIMQCTYDPSFYDNFRNESAFSSALTFARSSNYKAIAILFTYDGRECLDNWLPILSNFPEILSSFTYRNLLPECNSFGEVCSWEEDIRRENDWSELYCYKSMNVFNCSDFERNFYELNPNLAKYKGSLTREVVSDWYVNRSKQIESRTLVVENSLQLLKLGIERNIPNLNELHEEFETFSTIVYDCFPRSSRPNIMSFDEYQLLNETEVITLLMLGSNVDEKTFLRSLKHYLVPYLQKQSKGGTDYVRIKLMEYLVGIGKNDLSLCRAVFEDCVRDGDEDEYEDSPIITDQKSLLELALKVVYASVELDQLDEAFRIVECLPQRVENSPIDILELQDKIDDLEQHLAVAELLEKYDTNISLNKLRALQTSSNQSEVRNLFRRITKIAPKTDDGRLFAEKDWMQLLNDLLIIHKDCFSHVLPCEEISQMVVQSLIAQNLKTNMALVTRLLSKLGSDHRVEVILEATRSYLNSANSFNDENIAIAKECLKILNKAEAACTEVQEELDFIEAMAELDHDFDLNLLPVQIRLIEQPRLQLLKTLLETNRGSYKKVEKLLRLGKLLRVCVDKSPVQRDAQILTLLGNFALQAKDKATCWTICQRIIDNNICDGWKLCLELADDSNFTEVDSKLELLAFALTYCESKDGNLIRIILGRINDTRSSRQ